MLKKSVTSVLRLTILLLTALAIMDVAIPVSSPPTCRILLLDLSGSMTGKPADQKRRMSTLHTKIHDYIHTLQADEPIGLITFAGDTSVTSRPLPREVFLLPPKLLLPSNPDATNLDEAIQTALGLFPEGSVKELILISDGRFTQGRLDDLALAARSHDVRIYTEPAGIRDAVDLRVIDAVAPHEVQPETPFTIIARIAASHDIRATLQLENDDRILETKEITLTKTTTWTHEFTNVVLAPGASVNHFTVRILHPEDEYPQNNSYPVIVSKKESRARILYLTRDPANAPVHGLLESSDRFAVRTGKSLEDLFLYDAVILDDFDLQEMPYEHQEQIRLFVHSGGSLLVIGGPRSFALGNYRDTPVEKAMPVWASPDQTLSVVFAVDRSGSMGLTLPGSRQTKLNFATEAIQTAARLLTTRDYISVISFSGESTVDYPLSPVRRDQEFQTAMDRIGTGGNTDIYSAVTRAEKLLEDARTGRKHIVLITDGQQHPRNKDKNDFQKLRQNLNMAHISITVIATGAEIDKDLLNALSGEKYHHEHDLRKLENLLKNDMIEKMELIRDTGQPLGITLDSPASPLLTGLSTPPPIRKANSTTPRPGSQKILSAGGVPLLVQGQYGRGTTTALMTNFYREWTPDWAGWEEASQLVHNILSLLSLTPGTARVEHRLESQALLLTVTSSTFRTPVTADFINPQGKHQDTTSLHPKGFGRYEGVIPGVRPGMYTIKIKDPSSELKYTAPVPYSAEYERLGTDLESMKKLAEGTGGKMISGPNEIRRVSGKMPDRTQPGRRIFLILAVGLFLIELFLSTFWKTG